MPADGRPDRRKDCNSNRVQFLSLRKSLMSNFVKLNKVSPVTNKLVIIHILMKVPFNDLETQN